MTPLARDVPHRPYSFVTLVLDKVSTLTVRTVVPSVRPMLIAVMGTFGGTRTTSSTVLRLLKRFPTGMLTMGSAARVVTMLGSVVVTFVVVTTIPTFSVVVPAVHRVILAGAWRVERVIILKGTRRLPRKLYVPVTMGRLEAEFTTTSMTGATARGARHTQTTIATVAVRLTRQFFTILQSARRCSITSVEYI